MEEKKNEAVTVLFFPSQLRVIDEHRVKCIPPRSRQEVIRELVNSLSPKQQAR